MKPIVEIVVLPGDNHAAEVLCRELAAAGVEAHAREVGSGAAPEMANVAVVLLGPAVSTIEDLAQLSDSLNGEDRAGIPVIVYRSGKTPPYGALNVFPLVDATKLGAQESLVNLTSMIHLMREQADAATPARRGATSVPPLPVLGTPEPSRDQYRPLAKTAKAAQILLIAAAGAMVVLGVGNLLPRLPMVSGTGALFYLLAGLPAMVMYFIWFYRAHKNLTALNARGPKFGSPWTIFGYFVPFLNFTRPYQLMAEVWQGSDPDADVTDPTAWRSSPVSLFVRLWWAANLMDDFFSVTSTLTKSPGAASPMTATVFSVCDELSVILMLLITSMLISQATEREELRYAKLSGNEK